MPHGSDDPAKLSRPVSGLDRAAGTAPLRYSVHQSDCVPTQAGEVSDGVVGIDAEGATTVGHDVLVLGEGRDEIVEPVKLIGWDRDRSGEVTRGVLDFGSDVDQNQVTAPKSILELVTADHIEIVTVAEIGAGQILDGVELVGGEATYTQPNVDDSIRSHPVMDVGSFAAGGDQSGIGEGAEMMGGVGDRLADRLGYLFHRPLTLGQHLDDLDTPTRRQRLGDAGEPFEERILGFSSFSDGGQNHTSVQQPNTYSNDYLIILIEYTMLYSKEPLRR